MGMLGFRVRALGLEGNFLSGPCLLGGLVEGALHAGLHHNT